MEKDVLTYKINKELDELQNSLKSNIKAEMDRENELQDLDERAKKLKKTGFSYGEQSKRVKEKMMMKWWMWWIVLGGIVFICLFFFYKIFLK